MKLAIVVGPEVVALAGAGLAIKGISIWSAPAAWLCAGVALMAYAVFLKRAANSGE